MWKSSQVPSEGMLKQKLKTCIKMDRLTSILKSESNEDFKVKWCKVYKHLGRYLNHII